MHASECIFILSFLTSTYYLHALLKINLLFSIASIDFAIFQLKFAREN